MVISVLIIVLIDLPLPQPAPTGNARLLTARDTHLRDLLSRYSNSEYVANLVLNSNRQSARIYIQRSCRESFVTDLTNEFGENYPGMQVPRFDPGKKTMVIHATRLYLQDIGSRYGASTFEEEETLLDEDTKRRYN